MDRPQARRDESACRSIGSEMLSDDKEVWRVESAAGSASGTSLAWSIVSAVGALLLAWWFSWRARDLAWSLWLSSLLLGYVTMVVSLLRGGNPAWSLAKLVFFTFHFGFFHFVHSAFLSFLLPIDGVGEGPSAELYASVVRDYWPMVLASGLATIPRLRRPHPEIDGVISAYMGVLRLHLMIFVLVGMSFLGADHLLTFALVYLLSLLPLEARMERLITSTRGREAELLAAHPGMETPRRRHPRGDDDAGVHTSEDG